MQFFIPISLLLLPLALGGHALNTEPGSLWLDGRSLAPDFIYGCGTSAYQIEGAWDIDGKGPSIWDDFTHAKGMEHVAHDQNADVAMDFYHTFRQDIPLFFQALGINNYDYTIAWTRLLPEGRGQVALPAGTQFYLGINEAAHKAGGTTTCTLYHWDLPATLQIDYGGWLSYRIIPDFENYARVAMGALGLTCDNWISMNEPRTFCTEGYGPEPKSAPGIRGSVLSPYLCMHHALLAHSKAHMVFRELKEAGYVRGSFGIKIDGSPLRPVDRNSEADEAAKLRGMDFEIGWQVAPLTTGDYPAVMRETMGHDLPQFTDVERGELKGSYDIIFYDGYTSSWVKHADGPCSKSNNTWPVCVYTYDKYGDMPIGKPTGSEWNFEVNDTLYEGLSTAEQISAVLLIANLAQYADSAGLYYALSLFHLTVLGLYYMHDRWHAQALAIGETGLALPRSIHVRLINELHDTGRIEWYRNVFEQIDRILDEGVISLVGFVFWSCLSNFEWSEGYAQDYGAIYARPGHHQSRQPKLSAKYLRDVLTGARHSRSVQDSA